MKFPWTMGFTPSYETEGRIYANICCASARTRKSRSSAERRSRQGLHQAGIKQGLGDKAASMIVAEEAFDVSEPTIDSHIVKLEVDRCRRAVRYRDPEIRGPGDQAGRRARLEAAPHPQLLLCLDRQRDCFMGFDNAQGIISAAYFKASSTIPHGSDDAGAGELNAFLDSYFASADRSDTALSTATTRRRRWFVY